MDDLPFVVLVCWRCTDPGHSYLECKRPGARTRQEYDQRITDLLIRWDAGSIRGFGVSVKKRIIEIETREHEKERGK